MTEHWQVHIPDGNSQGVAMKVLSARETLINRWGYSSGVEHLTADQEVPGSNPGAPYHMSVFTHGDNTHTQSCLFYSFQSWTSPDLELQTSMSCGYRSVSHLFLQADCTSDSYYLSSLFLHLTRFSGSVGLWICRYEVQ